MDDSNCDPRERRLRWLTGCPAAVIVLVGFAWLADSSISGKCTTFDEIAHLTAGYSYWAIGDYRLNPENGMLPQRWAAMPLYMKGYTFADRDSLAWRVGDAFPVGSDFFYARGNDVDQMMRAARRMMIMFAVLLGLFVYGWSRRLFGRAGGMVSLLAFALGPNILAHSSLITSDIAVALGFTAAAASAWWMLHRVNIWSVGACSLAMGFLFLAKMSAVLVLPMLAVMIAVRLINGQPLPLGGRRLEKRVPMFICLAGAVCVCAAVTWLIIWAVHGFRYASAATDPMVFDWARFERVPALIAAVVEWARRWRLLPESYLYGFTFVVDTSAMRRSYLLGQTGQYGWWYYFPVCMLLKMPLGTFGLLAAAVAAAWSVVRRAKADNRSRQLVSRLYHMTPLAVILIIYWGFALRSHLNIGLRHLLPTFGAMLILSGAAGYWLARGHRVGRLVVLGCLVMLAVESWSIRPHYLAFFNQLAGGPTRGYRYLTDSNIDWGQDLPGLKKWLGNSRPKGDVSDIYMAYFGTGHPPRFGIDASFMPGFGTSGYNVSNRYELSAGLYCVSATMLTSCYLEDVEMRGPWRDQLEARWRAVDRNELQHFAATAGDRKTRAALVDGKGIDYWVHLLIDYDQLRQARLCSYLRQRKPDAHVGYSILIYRLTDADIDAAMNGPLPEMTLGRKKLLFGDGSERR